MLAAELIWSLVKSHLLTSSLFWHWCFYILDNLAVLVKWSLHTVFLLGTLLYDA